MKTRVLLASVLVTFTVCCLFLTAKGGTGDEEQAIHAAEMKMMRAAMTQDAAAFAAVCDPEYRTVNEDGSSQDLKEVIAGMGRDPLPKVDPPEMSENRIRIIGDTAFVSGRMKIRDPITYPKSPNLDLRFLEVWVKRNGEWKFAQWQATRVTAEGLARELRSKAPLEKTAEKR